ncbi:MAG: hypothetical protein HMLKMBBP_03295 [Planctomycetes bacterium]|nr:hypothetical protein [Planctomycetota bacterium]
MSQPNATTINNLTACLRLPGFTPGGYVDQFLRALPFEEAGGYGRQVQLNQASGLGDVSWLEAGDNVPSVAAVTALATFTFARIQGSVQVDDADIDASGTNNQLDLQTEARKVAVLRALSGMVINGNGVAPNLAGLSVFATGGQAFDLAGAAPTLANYHRLTALVRASDGFLGSGPDALVMSLSARRQLLSLLEASGSAQYCYELDERLGTRVLTFEGVPVYATEGAIAGEVTSVYAVKLSGPTGIRMLHVGGESDEFGIVVDEVPTQLDVSQRGRIVRGYYALLVPETASIAAMTGASVAGFVP